MASDATDQVLVVDTGVLVAAADTSDRVHRECAELVGDQAGQLVTTALVVAEAAYLLDRGIGPDAEAALYTSIIEGDLDVDNLDAHDWVRIRELVTTYADLHLGGTDACLQDATTGSVDDDRHQVDGTRPSKGRCSRKHAFARSEISSNSRRGFSPANPQVTSGETGVSGQVNVGVVSYYNPPPANSPPPTHFSRSPVTGTATPETTR